MSDVKQPAEWALDKAVAMMNEGLSYDVILPVHTVAHNVAAYIEQHEERSVDPDLEEAREICAKISEGKSLYGDAAQYRNGHWDDGITVQRTLAEIKHGHELESGQ